MFGISHLPFSTSITKFVNGFQEGIILHINRTDTFSLCKTTVITITLTIEQDKVLEL